MFRGYGFHIIAVGAWMVPEKLGLLRSGLRSLVKSAVWLRCGLRFQVKSAGRFRSGLHSTSFVPNCDNKIRPQRRRGIGRAGPFSR